MNIKALILSGEGINCELETAYAFKLAGAETQIMQVNDFLELASLDEFDILAFPGGFSFGDEIKSGKILAEKIKQFQFDNIMDFIKKGKPIIGICNGFQILTQLGVFDLNNERTVTLTENKDSKFINKWSQINIIDQENLWLKNLPSNINLPIRHKEGKIQIIENQNVKVALTYNTDENGSFSQIAGLVNDLGNVLGLMPHPEAAINNLLLPNHQDKDDQDNIALQIFKNSVNHMKGQKHAN